MKLTSPSRYVPVVMVARLPSPHTECTGAYALMYETMRGLVDLNSSAVCLSLPE